MQNSVSFLTGIYEGLRKSALCRTPVDADLTAQLAKFVEFENLLNKSAPTSDNERFMRECIRAHYKLSPESYAEYLFSSGHLELAIWADCGLLVRTLDLRGKVVVRWLEDTNKFVVEPYTGERRGDDRGGAHHGRGDDRYQRRGDDRRGDDRRGDDRRRDEQPRRGARDIRRQDRDIRQYDGHTEHPHRGGSGGAAHPQQDMTEAAKRVDAIGEKYRPEKEKYKPKGKAGKEKPVKERKGKSRQQPAPPKVASSSDGTPVATASQSAESTPVPVTAQPPAPPSAQPSA